MKPIARTIVVFAIACVSASAIAEDLTWNCRISFEAETSFATAVEQFNERASAILKRLGDAPMTVSEMQTAILQEMERVVRESEIVRQRTSHPRELKLRSAAKIMCPEHWSMLEHRAIPKGWEIVLVPRIVGDWVTHPESTIPNEFISPPAIEIVLVPAFKGDPMIKLPVDKAGRGGVRLRYRVFK